jgi:hypothetical protein
VACQDAPSAARRSCPTMVGGRPVALRRRLSAGLPVRCAPLKSRLGDGLDEPPGGGTQGPRWGSGAFRGGAVGRLAARDSDARYAACAAAAGWPARSSNRTGRPSRWPLDSSIAWSAWATRASASGPSPLDQARWLAPTQRPAGPRCPRSPPRGVRRSAGLGSANTRSSTRRPTAARRVHRVWAETGAARPPSKEAERHDR